MDDDFEWSLNKLKLFFDKNFITVDKLFTESKYNYLPIEELQRVIMSEIRTIEITIPDKADPSINDDLVNMILSTIARDSDGKVFKNEFQKYFSSRAWIQNDGSFKIKVNDNMIYWINKYIDIIQTVGLTPLMIFESAQTYKNTKIINLDDLKRQLKIVVPSHQWSQEDTAKMIDVLDINENRIWTWDEYNDMIVQVEYSKAFIRPKGNTKKKVRNNQFDVEDSVAGDNAGNFDGSTKNWNVEIDNSTVMKHSKMPMKRAKTQEEYTDEYLLILALDKYKPKNLNFPCFDLLNYLVLEHSFPRKQVYELIQELDLNQDGYISIVDLISFLLYKMVHRSTRWTWLYWSIKIYQEIKLESTEEFFGKNGIRVQNEINLKQLCALFKRWNIETPITKKWYDDMRLLFHDNITYKNLCEWIDETCPVADTTPKNTNTNNTQSITSNIIDMQVLEDGIQKILYNLIDQDPYINTAALRAKSFHENLKTVLDKCEATMTLSSYKKNFVKLLNIDSFIALTIFQLLETTSPKNEQIINKSDWIAFLESYIDTDDTVNVNNFADLISDLEKNGPSWKIVFNSIPFSRNGCVSVNEINKYLCKYYLGTLTKGNRKMILEYIDNNKFGFVSYDRLQKFLFDFSEAKYSPELEIKYLASSWIGAMNGKDYGSVSDYFTRNELRAMVTDYSCININDHKWIVGDLCSNKQNCNMLFNYLCQSQGKDGYNLVMLICLVEPMVEG